MNIYEYNNACYDLYPNGTYNSYINQYFCAKNYTYDESFEIVKIYAKAGKILLKIE